MLKNFNSSFLGCCTLKILIPELRQLVVEDGKEQLLVTYNSGESWLRRDSYLWEVGEEFLNLLLKCGQAFIPLDGVRRHGTVIGNDQRWFSTCGWLIRFTV
jgi:hypothetical protein